MTTFYLIRHAAHDLLGKALAGRMAGVPLNARGLEQSAQLAGVLARVPIAAVYSSPLERALQTARPLAQTPGLAVEIRPAFNEIDFGKWTGQEFAQLEADPLWRQWNADRSRAKAPGGESIAEVQARVMEALWELSGAHPGGAVAVVSHGDVIKAALMHCLEIPINNTQRFEISPASVSLLELGAGGLRVAGINLCAGPWEMAAGK